MKKDSFTLIELIIVMVIIGILAAIVIPKFINFREEAEKAAEEAIIGAIQSGIYIKTAEEEVRRN